MKTILVTGSAGRSSTGTMIASLLHAGGQTVLQIDRRGGAQPFEWLTVNGTPASIEDSAGLFSEMESVAGKPGRASAAVARYADSIGAGWLICNDAAAIPEQLDAVVFNPIMPSGVLHAGQVAQAICDGLPAAAIAVSAPQRESAVDVLRSSFPALLEVAQLCRLSRGRSDLDGQEFRLKTPNNEYRATLPVLGVFQIENATTAVLAVERVANAELSLAPQQVSTALAGLRLPGRLELLKRRPEIVVDSCSNNGSLKRAIEAISDLTRGRKLLVALDLGSDIEPKSALDILAPHAAELLLAPIMAAETQSDLREACYEAGIPMQMCGDMATAVDRALASADAGDAIAVLGSRNAAAAARAQVLGLMPPESGLHYTG